MSLFKKFPFGGSASLALAPFDLSSAAAATLWANMKDINDELWLLFFMGVGTAGDNATLSLQQAKTNAGGSAKVLNIKEVWFKKGAPTITNANSAAQDIWTKSGLQGRETPQPTYPTLTDRGAATNQFWAAIRIMTGDLDLANGFSYVQGNCTDVGTNAQLGFALWYPEGYALSGTNQSILV